MASSLRLTRVVRRPSEVRTPGPRIDGVRRISVVRDDRLGDLLVTLPAVHAIRRAYPDARLAMVVRRPLAPLVECVAAVQEVVGVGSAGATAGVDELRAALSVQAPDAVILISRGAHPAWAAMRAGIPIRVGTGRRWFSPCLTRTVVESRRHGGRHEAEYALSYAHVVGAVDTDAEFGLKIPTTRAEEAAVRLAALGLAGSFVVLHPGSGGSCPAWPILDHLALARRLRSEGLAVLLSIGPQDEAVAARLRSAPDPMLTLHRSTDPVSLGAILGRASLVVGSSTGPVHLAAALGTPTLALHAPQRSCAPERWGPYAPNGWALVAPRARARRLEGLAVDRVARAVLDLASGLPRSGG